MRSYFERIETHRLRPTPLTEGAWSTAEQHISPTNGLIVHELERWLAARGTDSLIISRIGIEILGVLDFTDMDVAIEVVRPGRTIELLEVSISQHDRVAVRARIWRIAATDTASVAGGTDAPLPAPQEQRQWAMHADWPGAFIRSLEVRPVSKPEPGRGTIWVSTPTALVAEEASSDLARFVGLVDTANGVAIRESPSAWMYPNLDLTIHLLRQPVGGWVGLDVSVAFGATGQGITRAVLHDEQGQVGTSEQILTVRRLPDS